MSDKNLSLNDKYKLMKDFQDKSKERSLLKQKMIEKVKNNLPPLSKLINNGELQCIVCNELVKNVNLWANHLKSPIHLKSLENLKQKLEKKEIKTVNQPKNILVQESVPIPIVSKDIQNFSNDFKIPNKHEKIKEIKENNYENKEKKNDKTAANIQDNDEKDIKNDNSQIKIFENSVEDSIPLPKGFFDNPEMENNLLNNQNLDHEENQENKLNQEIKMINNFLNEEFDNFQNDNLEEERQIYENRINSEVDKMVEFCEKVKGLFDNSSKPRKLVLIDEDNENKETISILKKKRKLEDLSDIFLEIPETKISDNSFEDVYGFDWRSKNLN